MATQESVAPMNTAEAIFTQGPDISDDTALILRPYSNWEQFLVPGPSSVSILGQLMFISANQDFEIDKVVPEEGFQYLKYPKSFRASLVQVSNEGCEAFREAQKNMDQIRLLTMNVPTDMRDVMMILTQEDPKVIENFLQIPLENIKSTADECLKLSKAVEGKFEGVISLISELLVACTGLKGVHEEQIREIGKEKELNEMKEKAAREAKAKLEERHRKLESELEQAQKDYKDSMDSIPVGWNAVGMAVVESLVDAVTSLSPGRFMKNLFSRGSRNEPSSAGSENNIIHNDEATETLTQMLYSFQTNDEKIDWKKLNSKKGAEMLSKCKQNLKKFQGAAGTGGDYPERDAALKICETGIGICEELEKLQKSEPADEEAMTDLALKIKQVMQDITNSTSDLKAKAGNTSPHMSRAEPGDGPRGLSTASLNARFKVEQSVAQLRAAQQLNEKSFEDMEKMNEKIRRFRENMQNCEIQKISFEETVKMLLEGLGIMGCMKQQWVKMVQLFTVLSSMIKCTLNPSINNFIQYSKMPSSSSSQKQFTKQMLRTPISQANTIASIVLMIAETYVEVSTQHLMDRVSSLGKLMGLDPNRDDIKFKQERDRFLSECSEAEKAIKDLAKTSKAQYEERLQARIDRIHNSVKTRRNETVEETM